ncbi:EexN family lipoprotein [Bartonella mastomydis]|uniref:EexN family lipoprotein n=1 Tax=Bartonella mastomydis TaxID=1820002 RepID=UPI0011178C3E|nr:EexN family lipoprotein [Bartonella mastomydis]
MNKVLIITLLLGTGLIAAGCEKTYSVAEFKKNPKLMDEWGARCGFTGTSKNCENLRLAALELQKEYEAKAEERAREAKEEYRKKMERFDAELKAEHEKWKIDFEKRKAEMEKKEAEEKAKERAEREAEEHAKAKQQQDNN